MTFKNIRIKKKGGGSRLQRVKVLASGKYKFVKNLTKSKSRTTKSKTKTKRRKTNVVRRKKRRGGKSLQPTVFKYLRLGSLAAPGLIYAAQKLPLDQKLNEIFRVYSGVNVKHSIESNEFQFDWKRLMMGWGPFLATTLVTYGIPKLAGIIRRL